VKEVKKIVEPIWSRTALFLETVAVSHLSQLAGVSESGKQHFRRLGREYGGIKNHAQKIAR